MGLWILIEGRRVCGISLRSELKHPNTNFLIPGGFCFEFVNQMSLQQEKCNRSEKVSRKRERWKVWM